jgi:hypothetical protein
MCTKEAKIDLIVPFFEIHRAEQLERIAFLLSLFLYAVYDPDNACMLSP